MTDTAHLFGAITGGIGAGKSYICQQLREMGVEVYDCDAAAKRLMRSDKILRERLTELVGKEVYESDAPRKNVLTAFLLASEENKQAVNAIVHPAVAQDFMASGCEWLESAILFESGFHQRVPLACVTCVVAPLETRLRRVMERDGISMEQASRWITTQMPQEEIASRSDYIVHNDGITPLLPQLRGMLRAIAQRKHTL